MLKQTILRRVILLSCAILLFAPDDKKRSNEHLDPATVSNEGKQINVTVTLVTEKEGQDTTSDGLGERISATFKFDKKTGCGVVRGSKCLSAHLSAWLDGRPVQQSFMITCHVSGSGLEAPVIEQAVQECLSSNHEKLLSNHPNHHLHKRTRHG